MKTILIATIALMTLSAAAIAQAPATTRAAAATRPAGPGPWSSGIEVTIKSAKPEYLILNRAVPNAAPEELVANEVLIVLRLTITNKGQKEITYHSFNGTPEGKGADRAMLLDDKRKFAAVAQFGPDTQPAGSVKSVTLKPGESVNDLVAFAPPAAGAKPALLYLPAKNHGDSGLWKLEVKLTEGEAVAPK